MIAQIGDHHAHAQAVDERDEGEFEHGKRAVQLVVVALAVDDRVGPVDLQQIREAQFRGQADDGVVVGEEVMVKVFQGPIPGGAAFEASRQAAQHGTGLEERHLGRGRTGLGQIIGRAQPGDAAADDGDAPGSGLA